MGAVAGRRIDRRRLLLAAAACLGGALLLAAWLHLVSPLPGERWVGDWQQRWSPHEAGSDVASALDFFDTLATPWIAAGLVLAAAAVVWENDGPRWSALVVASSAVVVPNAVLKHLLSPTPLWDELYGRGLSYPSGHVAFATAFFGALALIGARHRQRALTVTLLALIPIMAVDRVLAGAHLPSDTIGGFLVGAGWLLAAVALIAPDR